MINRSAVLTAAWKSYHLVRPAVFAAGDTATHRKFLRALFSKMLRQAWADAKKAVASTADVASAFVAAQSRAMAQKAAALPPCVRSARIAGIRNELEVLDYAPWGVRTGNRRADLTAQLDALTGEAR